MAITPRVSEPCVRPKPEQFLEITNSIDFKACIHIDLIVK